MSLLNIPEIPMLTNLGNSILDAVDPTATIRAPVAGWAFLDFQTAALIAFAYVAFVALGSMIFRLSFVPKIDPYPLKFMYNLSQMMLCSYMTIEAFLVAYRNNYTITPCNEFDIKNPPMATLLWIFYVSKIWDFWDTIFIIIGKKWNQLSFLHVYHHTTIFLFYWLNANVLYDGDIYLTVLLNGMIHTIMYTYYFVSMHTKIPGSGGKSVPIWWKPILTFQQMVQFVVMMSQATYLIQTDCPTMNKPITKAYLGYIGTLLFLFAQFFYASYMAPKPRSSGSKKRN